MKYIIIGWRILWAVPIYFTLLVFVLLLLISNGPDHTKDVLRGMGVIK